MLKDFFGTSARARREIPPSEHSQPPSLAALYLCCSQRASSRRDRLLVSARARGARGRSAIRPGCRAEVKQISVRAIHTD